MNPGTVIVLLIVAVIIYAIIFFMVKSRKNGKSPCGCGCKDCPNTLICRSGSVKKT